MIDSFDYIAELQLDPNTGLYNLFISTYNGSTAMVGFHQVTRSEEMRMDKVSKRLFQGSTKYVGTLCQLNDIMNPYSIKEGDILVYCNTEQALNMMKVASIIKQSNIDELMSSTKRDLLNSFKKTKQDPSRRAYLNQLTQNNQLPPTVLPGNSPQIVIANNKIKIGNSGFTPRPSQRAEDLFMGAGWSQDPSRDGASNTIMVNGFNVPVGTGSSNPASGATGTPLGGGTGATGAGTGLNGSGVNGTGLNGTGGFGTGLNGGGLNGAGGFGSGTGALGSGLGSSAGSGFAGLGSGDGTTYPSSSAYAGIGGMNTGNGSGIGGSGFGQFGGFNTGEGSATGTGSGGAGFGSGTGQYAGFNYFGSDGASGSQGIDYSGEYGSDYAALYGNSQGNGDGFGGAGFTGYNNLGELGFGEGNSVYDPFNTDGSGAGSGSAGAGGNNSGNTGTGSGNTDYERVLIRRYIKKITP